MRSIDYIRTALKNLARQKSRTFLTIVAITVGSLSVILMISLLIGVRTSMMETFEEMGAFNLVTVTPDPDAAESGGGGLISGGHNEDVPEDKKLTESVYNTLLDIPHVADATPVASGIWVNSARLEGEDKKIWPDLLGYIPESDVFNLPLLAGRGLTSEDMDKVVVGSRFLKTYGYEDNPEDLVGQNLVLTFDGNASPDWGGLPEKPPMNADRDWWESQGEKTKDITAEIVGVAKNTGMSDNQNFITIGWAEKLMTQQNWQYPDTADYHGPVELEIVKYNRLDENGYSSIILKADDMSNVTAVGEEITALGYGATTAENMIEEIDNMFKGIGIILGAIGGISLFVAAIGIINTMIMATYERTREIGVMRACGATKNNIRQLFTAEAALLGFWGGVSGMVVSFIIGRVGKVIAERYVSTTDIPFSLDYVGTFPWWLVVGAIAFATLIGLLSGLYPAYKASRLNPIDALRYE